MWTVHKPASRQVSALMHHSRKCCATFLWINAIQVQLGLYLNANYFTSLFQPKDKNYLPGSNFLATFSASRSKGPLQGQLGSSGTPARRDIKWADSRPPTTEITYTRWHQKTSPYWATSIFAKSLVSVRVALDIISDPGRNPAKSGPGRIWPPDLRLDLSNFEDSNITTFRFIFLIISCSVWLGTSLANIVHASTQTMLRNWFSWSTMLPSLDLQTACHLSRLSWLAVHVDIWFRF